MRKKTRINTFSKAMRGFSLMDKIPAVFRMLKAVFKGEYKMKLTSMLLLLAGTVYIFIPEFTDLIPFIGWLDELTVLGFVIKKLLDEVEKFLNWELETKSSTQYEDVEAKIIK
ncbi:MAG: hypothetical protein H6604_07795 [Flavobacteriales bacterium]|nr:hypothetical protein [Flavobacteriales bacterium]